LIEKGRFRSWIILTLSAFFFLSVFAGTCSQLHDPLPESKKVSQIFDVDEKIIVKAITRVLKNRGFGTARVEADNSRLETDYVVEGDWRTKVVATIEKIGPKKREVTLSVITERKSSDQWQPKELMMKEQYDRLFGEIEMQIYREIDERQ
jgi:ACT domain-containing protein